MGFLSNGVYFVRLSNVFVEGKLGNSKVFGNLEEISLGLEVILVIWVLGFGNKVNLMRVGIFCVLLSFVGWIWVWKIVVEMFIFGLFIRMEGEGGGE